MKRLLQKFGDDIWVHEGETVSFHGMPYTTRMTIVRLNRGDLWVHSPTAISEPLLVEVTQLGAVQYLISPNKIHHLYMQDWLKRFPTARLFAPPGLKKKRRDLAFHACLQDHPETEWGNEIDQIIFKGSAVMEEVVFFHKKSKTLIVADLIENFPPDHFKGLQKCLAHSAGIIAPNGKTPLDWRLTFYLGRKAQAKQCTKALMGWEPEQIIMAHGQCIKEQGTKFLKRSFSWLL
jgi:hypothetical protein